MNMKKKKKKKKKEKETKTDHAPPKHDLPSILNSANRFSEILISFCFEGVFAKGNGKGSDFLFFDFLKLFDCFFFFLFDFFV